jgi:hypothetical protein
MFIQKVTRLIAICALSHLGLAHSQDSQISVMLGQTTQIPLNIKVANDTTRCNLEISIPGQNKFEREVSAPDFQTLLDFTPPNEGVFVIEWKGRLKRRGLNSVLGCDASGKVVVSAKPGTDQIAAKWNDYFSKIKPEGAECVKTGMELSQLYFESSDPNAKLTLPTDQVLRPIYDKCDAFMRAKQPQQNFACTLSGGIRSFCDSVYAERRSDGQLTRISRIEAIKLQLAGREWALGNVETADAKTNRVRLEEEARNRQAADSAAKQKQEEEQKAKQAADAAGAAAAAAAARKRQEEAKARPSPSQEANRTSAPSTQPKQEQPKAEPAPPPPPKQEPAKPKPTVKSTTDL